jgi:hypothetical protein
MVSNLVFSQLILIALVWVFLMLYWLWSSEPAAARPTTSKPLTPPRTRSKEPKPFPGLVVFQKWRWPSLHCPSKGIAIDK